MQRLSQIGKCIASRFRAVAVLALVATFSVAAYAADSYNLVVKLKNGEKSAFLLADKPEVTFTGDQCVIECKTIKSYFKMADIDLADFQYGTSAIEEVNLSDVILDFSDPSKAVVKGLEEGTMVSLYTLDGIAQQACRADSEGEAVFDLNAIPAGSIFIISVNSVKNFKLYKK